MLLRAADFRRRWRCRPAAPHLGCAPGALLVRRVGVPGRERLALSAPDAPGDAEPNRAIGRPGLPAGVGSELPVAADVPPGSVSWQLLAASRFGRRGQRLGCPIAGVTVGRRGDVAVDPQIHRASAVALPQTPLPMPLMLPTELITIGRIIARRGPVPPRRQLRPGEELELRHKPFSRIRPEKCQPPTACRSCQPGSATDLRISDLPAAFLGVSPSVPLPPIKHAERAEVASWPRWWITLGSRRTPPVSQLKPSRPHQAQLDTTGGTAARSTLIRTPPQHRPPHGLVQTGDHDPEPNKPAGHNPDLQP